LCGPIGACYEKRVAERKAQGGTPATVQLRARGIEFTLHEFDHPSGERAYGTAAAEALGIAPERVFKTLLATAEGLAPPGIAVAIVPVSGQLSLKELAVALGAKRAAMCDPTVAERVTGYVVGGISPFGQRRALPTAIDATCRDHRTIFVSGGRRGLEIELAPDDLIAVLAARVAPIGS
jgi:Cys-tRNA(Pro)/Cys-tRNA(Cys) deacylase